MAVNRVAYFRIKLSVFILHAEGEEEGGGRKTRTFDVDYLVCLLYKSIFRLTRLTYVGIGQLIYLTSSHCVSIYLKQKEAKHKFIKKKAEMITQHTHIYEEMKFMSI